MKFGSAIAMLLALAIFAGCSGDQGIQFQQLEGPKFCPIALDSDQLPASDRVQFDVQQVAFEIDELKALAAQTREAVGTTKTLVEKLPETIRQIVREELAEVKPKLSTSFDVESLPNLIVMRTWENLVCEACERWLSTVKPELEAVGCRVRVDKNLSESESAPVFTLCWCGENCDCNTENCESCGNCEKHKGYLSFDAIVEISKNCPHEKTATAKVDVKVVDPQDRIKRDTVSVKCNASGTLKVASSLRESEQTGASIVIDPSLNAHIEQRVSPDGKPVGPLVVKPRYVRNYLNDNCVSSVSVQSNGFVVTETPVSVSVHRPVHRQFSTSCRTVNGKIVCD